MTIRWSHRNHPGAIRQRQQMIRALPTWLPEDERTFAWAVDPERLMRHQEALTGQMVFPVSVVGPLRVRLGRYQVEESGSLTPVDRYQDDVLIPLVHTEGGLSASMQRGIHAVNAAGGVRTDLLGDMMTRDCAFVFDTAPQAVEFWRWLQPLTKSLTDWLNDPNHPGRKILPGQTVSAVSRHARLVGIDGVVVGPVCHVLYKFFTGEACGPNMMTRNAYALNQAILARLPATGPSPLNIYLEANLGGDKKPSHQYFNGGHGKTVTASASLSHAQLRRYLNITADELRRLEWAGLHGSQASGMQSFGFTPASAVAALFAATGQDLGMVGTSSMAHATIQVTEAGAEFSLQLGGIEVGTVGGGTTLPHAQSYLRLLGCLGPGSSQRLAQLVGAAALALEISAAAAMAGRGSENFFRAHLERGGHR
ncbi:MAG: 3-hydroxy-3-methylglutaryl-CoA reductase [Thermaerobacter sp.]|nr:3-hydroxy-3-methylglutaryl-CoA reductase [Thermaerobacter sp.]